MTEGDSTRGDGRARFVKPGVARTVVTPPRESTWQPVAPPFAAAPPPVAMGYLGPLEVLALVALAFGWMLPGVGLLVAIVAVLISPRWTAGEKALAIVLPVVLVVVPFVEFLHEAFSPGLQGVVDTVTWFALMCVMALVAWPGAAIFLWIRARRRRFVGSASAP